MLVAAGGDRNIRGEEGLGMGKGIGTVLLVFFVVNTFVFFLLLTIITMAIPEQSWVRGKLPS